MHTSIIHIQNQKKFWNLLILCAIVQGCNPSSYYDHPPCKEDEVYFKKECVSKKRIWISSKECSDISENKIASDISFYACDGSKKVGAISICQKDGDSNCIVSNKLKAANKNQFDKSQIKTGKTLGGITGTANAEAQVNALEGIDPWDVRVGIQISSITGKLLVNCRNRINNSNFNYDGAIASLPNTAVATGTTGDIWDTIEDSGPTNLYSPSSWTSNRCGGVEIVEGDSNVWKDVTTTGDGFTKSSCSATPSHCTMMDKITKVHWSPIIGTAETVNWSTSLQACDALNYNGFSDWRLPTAYELQEAHNHGARDAASVNWHNQMTSMSVYYWSATSSSSNTNNAIYKRLDSAYTPTDPKTTLHTATCVRDP